MVNYQSIFFMGLSCIIAVFLPLGLMIYFYKRLHISLKAVLVGASVFFVFQIVLRIPFLNNLGQTDWFKNLVSGQIWSNYLVFPLFLALTAGIFEEIGRYFGFYYFLRNDLEWKNGLAFGVGHGGIESILLIGFSFLNNLVISLMINFGAFESQIASKLPAETAQALKNSLISAQPWLFAAGGLERISALAIQIAFSLMVLYSVKFRKVRFLFYAILLHAIADFPAGLYQMKALNLWVTELITLAFAGIAVYYIVKSKETFGRVEDRI